MFKEQCSVAAPIIIIGCQRLTSCTLTACTCISTNTNLQKRTLAR